MGIGKVSRFTLQNAANMDAAIGWEVQSAISLTDDSTSRVELKFPVSWVWVQSDYDIYISFSLDSTANVDSSNDVWIPGGTYAVQIRVPWGMDVSKDKTLYLLVRRKTSTTTTVRVVLC